MNDQDLSSYYMELGSAFSSPRRGRPMAAGSFRASPLCMVAGISLLVIRNWLHACIWGLQKALGITFGLQTYVSRSLEGLE